MQKRLILFSLLIVAVVVISGCTQQTPPKDSKCTSFKPGSTCDAFYPGYYFNSQSNKCEYTGAGSIGNDSCAAPPFKTSEECQQICGGPKEPPKNIQCEPFDPTDDECENIDIGYYVSSVTGKCEYNEGGSCKSIPFQTLGECQQVCGGSAPDGEKVCDLGRCPVSSSSSQCSWRTKSSNALDEACPAMVYQENVCFRFLDCVIEGSSCNTVKSPQYQECAGCFEAEEPNKCYEKYSKLVGIPSPYTIGEQEQYVPFESCGENSKLVINDAQIIKSLIHSCTESPVKVEGKDGASLVFIEYGPGQDCPAGCIYNRHEALVDKDKNIFHTSTLKDFPYNKVRHATGTLCSVGGRYTPGEYSAEKYGDNRSWVFTGSGYELKLKYDVAQETQFGIKCRVSGNVVLGTNKTEVNLNTTIAEPLPTCTDGEVKQSIDKYCKGLDKACVERETYDGKDSCLTELAVARGDPEECSTISLSKRKCYGDLGLKLLRPELCVPASIDRNSGLSEFDLKQCIKGITEASEKEVELINCKIDIAKLEWINVQSAESCQQDSDCTFTEGGFFKVGGDGPWNYADIGTYTVNKKNAEEINAEIKNIRTTSCQNLSAAVFKLDPGTKPFCEQNKCVAIQEAPSS